MREIGSEFWDAPISNKINNIFPKNTKWFLSGRIALRYIIRDIKLKKNIHTAALPSWCCDSMIIPFIQENIKVLFYKVYLSDNGLVQISDVIADVILVIDYFGFSTKQDFSNYNGIVIRDLTHSVMFNIHNDASYYFGSLRKWCGIYTGGFSYGNFSNNIRIDCIDNDYLNLRKEAMLQKKAYIDGEMNEKNYLNLFLSAEKMLDNISSVIGSDNRDIFLAEHLDIDLIKAKRRNNFEVLHKELSSYLIIKEYNDDDCPLFFPIIVNNRDLLKKYLINNQIYCPVHWPITALHKLDVQTSYIYTHELSIVCDQRYSEEDMEYMCSVIKEGMKLC